VLVSNRKDLSLKSGEGFIVGTSSTRRVATLKHFYPHIRTVDMRGNLQTRLRKLEEGQCDALLLAYAGVHRMNYDDLIAEHLSLDEFTPAVGQGSVAIECSASLSSDKKELLKTLLNHPETETCLKAERAFLKTLQGGCSIPVFGLATIIGDQLHLAGGIVSLDGSERICLQDTSDQGDPALLGHNLAQRLLEAGADRILREIRGII
jgi:hydroxymethylbilane synthase